MRGNPNIIYPTPFGKDFDVLFAHTETLILTSLNLSKICFPEVVPVGQFGRVGAPQIQQLRLRNLTIQPSSIQDDDQLDKISVPKNLEVEGEIGEDYLAHFDFR